MFPVHWTIQFNKMDASQLNWAQLFNEPIKSCVNKYFCQNWTNIVQALNKYGELSVWR